MKTLHFAGQVGGPYGWGVFGKYMTHELGKLFRVGPLVSKKADVCLMPLADHNFVPATGARGKINLAITFFESELGQDVEKEAAKYDLVLCGSTWCKDRLAERGILNTRVLIQGVDSSIFYPRQRKPDGQFRIFSGGKFEWRKGQDLVIRAFAQFAKDHPEAHLVCSWFNPWPALAVAGANCAGLSGQGGTLEAFYADMLTRAGIPADRFTILPQLSHEQLAEEMAQTDCGLFPNRCEGGTNLVLMEYAACGRHVIANYLTGHGDVEELIDDTIPASLDTQRWADQTVHGITNRLEYQFTYRPLRTQTRIIPTWQAAAKTVADAVNEIARHPVAV